jgi:MoxR-like ATPase
MTFGFDDFDNGSAKDDLSKQFGEVGQIVVPSDARAPILTAPVRAALHQWLYEMNSVDELASVGLKPRSRCLLSGPPGCGKTTLAHHISARLGVPMLVIQSHEIVSNYLGESGNRIGRLFRSARRTRTGLALFFDEFDALAKKRESLGTSGADNERTNITIALLQEFDRYDGLLFAATNQTELIDPAIWRRFQMQIEIGLPGPTERFAIVRMYLAPFDADDDTVHAIAAAFADAAPSLIQQGCEAIRRSMVLGPKMKLSTELPDIMDRFAAGASPPEGMPVPPLWSDPRRTRAQLAKAPWPPERAA